MKRNLWAPPDTFSVSPLFSLLPTEGKPEKLLDLLPSLFARLERVESLRRTLGDEADAEQRRRCLAEEMMLRRVLDWAQLYEGE